MKLNSRQLSMLLTEGMEVTARSDSSPRLMTPKEMYISTLHTSSSFHEFSTLACTWRHGRRSVTDTLGFSFFFLSIFLCWEQPNQPNYLYVPPGRLMSEMGCGGRTFIEMGTSGKTFLSIS